MNLQSCEVVILQFENFNFEHAQITKLQNYLYVDFTFENLEFYKCAFANLNFAISNIVML
jgi:hypothetical protein